MITLYILEVCLDYLSLWQLQRFDQCAEHPIKR